MKSSIFASRATPVYLYVLHVDLSRSGRYFFFFLINSIMLGINIRKSLSSNLRDCLQISGIFKGINKVQFPLKFIRSKICRRSLNAAFKWRLIRKKEKGLILQFDIFWYHVILHFLISSQCFTSGIVSKFRFWYSTNLSEL